MNAPIDLGQDPDDRAAATGIPAPDPDQMDEGQEAEPNYPQLNIEDNPNAALANFPETGTSIVKHSVVSRKSAKGKDGKHRHSLVLKIHSIKPHRTRKGKGKNKPLPGGKDDEAAIENYLNAGAQD